MYINSLKLLAFIACLLCPQLVVHGALEDYFKPAIEKDPVASMANIDYIYMINLDQRPEKWQESLEQLAPYGIVPHRFSAVNGWELTGAAINQLGLIYEPWMAVKMQPGLWGTYYIADSELEPNHEVISVPGRTYFCHCMARGTIGICLSHLSVLQDAYDSGYQTVWIMEDDIQVIRNPVELSCIVGELDRAVGVQGWDILFTDQDTKDSSGQYVPCRGHAFRPDFSPVNPERFAQRGNVNRYFQQLGARFGAYSYIIRREGMAKILNHFKTNKIFLPYDMEFYLPADIKLFCVQDDVVSTKPNALSDNGGPFYEARYK